MAKMQLNTKCIFVLWVCIICSPFLVVADSATDSQLVVHTPSGDIRGRIEPVVYGLSVRQFRGLPFAEPPIGKLRFAKPQPAQPWTGVRDATEFGPICPQIDDSVYSEMETEKLDILVQSEDCLTLNVYTPQHARPGDNKAVMVYVHGGGFNAESGLQYDPSVIVSLYDVIVVTINYRLGVLGFFNIPGTEFKGNQAMHDQVLALRWVQHHIASFGGNPGSVTIFGHSAGGVSVSLHHLSPLSKGLFHRVIAQSGSSALKYGNRPGSKSQRQAFAKLTGCPSDAKMVECLRAKSVEELIQAQAQSSLPTFTGIIDLTAPTIDGDFLPDDARKLLREGRVNEADIMAGLSTNEGVLFAMMLREGSRDGLPRQDFEHVVRHGIPVTINQSKLVEDAMIHTYTDHRDPNNNATNRQEYINMMTDGIFAAPAVFVSNCLANNGKATYFYVFENLPDFFKWPSKWMHSTHGLELVYVFGLPLYTGHNRGLLRSVASRWSAREVGFSMEMMRMWTDFAKYGDPNHSGKLPVTWPRYNSTVQAHLVISLEPRVEYKFRADKMAFWNKFVPKLTEVEPKRKQQKEANKGETSKEEF